MFLVWSVRHIYQLINRHAFMEDCPSRASRPALAFFWSLNVGFPRIGRTCEKAVFFLHKNTVDGHPHVGSDIQ